MPFWAPLVADAGLGRSRERFPAPPRDRGPAAHSRDDDDGEVAVVFVDLGDSAVDDRLGMLAARALRPGGVLAVLTRCRHTDTAPAELLDPTGMVVASAQNADLLYLQHIVIPLAPLTPPPHGQAPPPSADRTAASAHHSAHADLLLFARSGHPGPAPDTAAEATR
ncbi:hypothetical protein [Pseudonocardia sp.]|uniref:hypothetical protein n=1 Tax=Pseudonocardia sp. TaxID=60912 RepID=UPI003D0AF1F7